jgi:predicted Zn-ribbon and HTH transcriptional regulator
MTREELKAHCEKQIEMCEFWAIVKGEKPSGKVYEEHKLILELLKQEPKTGHWLKIKPYPLQMHDFECSNCGHEVDDNDLNYCSECGSKMVEHRKGRWIYGEDNLGTGRDGWYCNQCAHFEFWDYSSDLKSAKLNLPNVCPNCGARMVEPYESEE